MRRCRPIYTGKSGNTFYYSDISKSNTKFALLMVICVNIYELLIFYCYFLLIYLFTVNKKLGY